MGPEFDETLVYDEIIERLKRIGRVERAELVIRNYCKVMNVSKELDRRFEEWLGENAYVALQTDAFEEYFIRMTGMADIAPVDIDEFLFG